MNVAAKVGVANAARKNISHFVIDFCRWFFGAIILQQQKKIFVMAKEIVISNSKLNSYGFRVLTGGIDIAQFQRNPILLWQHNRTWRGTTDEVLPIGRMENLRFEGDSLIGTPVFDDNDEFARKIKVKFESGFLKMCSPGFSPIETSNDADMLLPGQWRPTITKAKLLEVSIVDIGANDDALALYRDSKLVKLAAGGSEASCELDLLLPKIEFKPNLNPNKMKTVAIKLGLAESASEADILTLIGKLQEENKEVVTLKKEIEAQREKAVESEVDAAIKLNKITADKRAHFVQLGKTAGLDTLRSTLECIAPAVKPLDITGAGSRAAAGASEKKYEKLSDVPAKERIELRKNDPEAYKKLYENEYGFAPEINV
jgi:hypothetical protein